MKIARLFIFILGMISVTIHLSAQVGPGFGDPSNGNPTPITGIEILLALGGLFGVKKVIDFRKKK